MNGITFKRQQGGLGRTLEGSDHISGLIVYGEQAVAKTLLLSVEDLALQNITTENNPVLHYHASEFFRINEGAKLYVQAVENSDGAYSEVKVMQNFSEGNIRQIAVCDFKTAVSSLSASVAKLNQIATELGNACTPLSVLLSLKITTSDMVSLPDLHTLNAERVSVVLGQDGGGRGAYLAQTSASVSCIGAVLGAVSKANVHESIGWVEKQNLVSTAYAKALTGDTQKALELDVPAFCDGSKLGDYTPAQIQAIHDKGYIFLTKYTGATGTYFNDSFTATSLTSDYAYIEFNRVIGKAIRGINVVLLPKVSGPVYINPESGKVDLSTVKSLEALTDDVLSQMKKDGELSGYEVSINPDQQVLRTSNLEIVVKLVPVGTLREILVKIGLTLKTE